MSRAIQVRVSESVVRTIHVEDGVAAQLEVLPVLPAERMAELLAAELEKLGFVRTADGTAMSRAGEDGLDVTIELRTATVTVKLGAGDKITETIATTARVAEEAAERIAGRMREDMRRELDERVAARAEQLRAGVTRALEGKLGELRAELDGAIGKTTVAALTERAAQLGTIEEMHADEAGNVTIRVKL
jgi:hypothetical protein